MRVGDVGVRRPRRAPLRRLSSVIALAIGLIAVVPGIAQATPTQLATPVAPNIAQTSPTSISGTFTPDPNALSSTINLYDGGVPAGQETGITTGSFSFSSLVTGDTYSATVTSVGDEVNSIDSAEGAMSAPVTLTIPQLAAPAAPSIGQTTISSITVTYTPDPHATSSTITLNDLTTSTPISDTDNTTGSNVFTGLTAGNTYDATITSIGDGSNYLSSSAGAVSSSVTLALTPLPKPAAPTLSQTTTTSITVNFTPNPQATSSTITLTNTSTNATTPITGNTSGTSLFSGLTPTDTYSAAITSIGDGENFSNSPLGTASTPLTLTLPQLAKPAAPTLSQTTPTSITVTFTPDPNAVSSTITLTNTTTSAPTSITNNTSGTALFSGLTPTDTYSATITSIGDGTNFGSSSVGTVSAPLTLTLPQLAQPAAPTLAQVTPTSIKVTFTPDPNALSSTITFHDVTANSTTPITGNTTGTFTFSGLTTGDTFTATITSVGDGTNFATSIVGTTSAPLSLALLPLGAPQVSLTSTTNTSVTVTFASVQNSSSYTAVVYNGANVVATNTTTCVPAACVVSGLTANSPYTVVVTANGDHITYSSSSPSTAVPFVTTSVGPTNAPPPSGVSTSSLGVPVSGSASKTASTTITLSTTSTSSTITIPPGALPAGTTVSAYPITSVTALAAQVPANHSYVVAVAISWQTGTGTSPDATVPLTLTITDVSIVAGDTIYVLTSSGMVVAGTATVSGSATITFTADPVFVVTAVAKSAQSPLLVNTATVPVSHSVKLSTIGGSGSGAITYSVSDGTAKGCTLTSSSPITLSATTYGTCTVTATKAADSDYGAVSSVAATFNFTALAQAALKVSSTKGTVGKAVNLSATGGSGTGVVVFNVANGTATGCTIAHATAFTLTSASAGTCLVVARKSGDDTHAATSSPRVAIPFSLPKVGAKPKVSAIRSQIRGGATTSIVLTGSGLKGGSVSTTTKGVAVRIVSSTATSITLSLKVASSVRSGVYRLTVTNKRGSTTTTFQVIAKATGTIDSLITTLFAGYRTAWSVSPTAGIIYAYQHDYPGSATSESAFLACYQKANVAQTGETDTPILSTLRLTPSWEGIGPDTSAWNFAGKKPSGTTYSVTDVETSLYSSGPPSHITMSVHVTILNGVAYFYFVPAC